MEGSVDLALEMEEVWERTEGAVDFELMLPIDGE